MKLYFDTSALLKLLVDERGSERAAQLWATADNVASSRLVHPEARAALAAARRARRISPSGLRSAVDRLAGLMAGMTIVEVNGELAGLAGELAERHALRGYDAVHLASALAIDDPDLVLATWDGDLARAAVATGRRAAPV